MTTYQPTKNLFAARLNGTLKELREAAEKEALSDFMKGLELEGWSSLEEYKEEVLTWEEGEILRLRSYAYEDEEEMESLAAHPRISPKDSFWYYVRACEHALESRLFNEALGTLEARTKQSN